MSRRDRKKKGPKEDCAQFVELFETGKLTKKKLSIQTVVYDDRTGKFDQPTSAKIEIDYVPLLLEGQTLKESYSKERAREWINGLKANAQYRACLSKEVERAPHTEKQRKNIVEKTVNGMHNPSLFDLQVGEAKMIAMNNPGAPVRYETHHGYIESGFDLHNTKGKYEGSISHYRDTHEDPSFDGLEQFWKTFKPADEKRKPVDQPVDQPVKKKKKTKREQEQESDE